MIRLFRNKLFIGAVCLLGAGILAFGLLPRLYSAQSSTTEIVMLKKTAEPGTVISSDMLTIVEVGSYGLPGSVVKEKSELLGLAVRETAYAGEYLWHDRFVSKDDYEGTKGQDGYGLSEGKYLLTISLPSTSAGIAGILRSGAVVDVYGYMEQDGRMAVTEALIAVTVFKVLNNKLVPLDDLDAKLDEDPHSDPSNYDFAPAYIVFVVNEMQAKVLIGLEKEKSLHLTLRETGARP